MPTVFNFTVKNCRRRSMSLSILWSVVVYCCCPLLSVFFSRCCSLTQFYDTYSYSQKYKYLVQTGSVFPYSQKKWETRTCPKTVHSLGFSSRRRQGAKIWIHNDHKNKYKSFARLLVRKFVISIIFSFCRGYPSQKRN